MKKFTAILLALGLSVSALVAFTACDNTQSGDPAGVDTEVTKEEFEAAFTLGENYVCTAEVVYEGLGIERWQFKRAGNLVETCIEVFNLDYTPYEGEYATYNYVEKDGDNVYYYSPTTKQDGTVEFYRKEERTESFEYLEYEDLSYLLMPLLVNFDLYTYNAETQAYEAASVEISSTSRADNLSWKFTENKLVSGNYVMHMAGDTGARQMPVSFTITYGNATIVLPTNVR